MKIIDTHVHFSDAGILKETAQESGVDYSLDGLRQEFKTAGVTAAVGMGMGETKHGRFPDVETPTPLTLDLAEKSPDNLFQCPGVNPHQLGKQELDALEQLLKLPSTVGIKIYLGYYHFYATDPVYEPVYELAKAYQLPVVFHTGDAYSEKGMLKYSHPLTLDEVAVTHREVNFIIAHFGDPWMIDVAEILFKNENTFGDLSGLIVGDKKELQRTLNVPHHFDHMKHALAFCDDYERVLFGSDWPLAPIQDYAEFIQHFIPESEWENVFYYNALRAFPKIQDHITD